MHIGVVTSSLGPRLGDTCLTRGACSKRRRDRCPRTTTIRAISSTAPAIPTISRTTNENPLASTWARANFLDWFPPCPANAGHASTPGAPPIGDPAQLSAGLPEPRRRRARVRMRHRVAARELVPLPHPARSVRVSARPSRRAARSGRGSTRPSWRSAPTFLRPDSLVAIIVLSDENDSEVDVRSFGGTAWNYMSTRLPPAARHVGMRRPTRAIPACTSCAFGTAPIDSMQCTNATPARYLGTRRPRLGIHLNLRHVHQKQKYGVSVQFPISASPRSHVTKVPDRNGEYPPGATELPGSIGHEPSDCTNPLYRGEAPCAAGRRRSVERGSPRPKRCAISGRRARGGLVYYAHIGGVPHQLLQQDPRNPDSPQKTTLGPADWTLILGNDPVNYDYSGSIRT